MQGCLIYSLRVFRDAFSRAALWLPSATELLYGAEDLPLQWSDRITQRQSQIDFGYRMDSIPAIVRVENPYLGIACLARINRSTDAFRRELSVSRLVHSHPCRHPPPVSHPSTYLNSPPLNRMKVAGKVRKSAQQKCKSGQGFWTQGGMWWVSEAGM
jgi:hypothetical protein